MNWAGARFLTCEECGSYLDSLCAEGECCDYAPCVCYSAGSDDRYIDGIDHLRDEGESTS
jgi:hypothetical protein